MLCYVILLACEPPGRSCALSPAPPQERPGELGSQANILPVPWPFHCNFFVNVPRGTPGKFWWGCACRFFKSWPYFKPKKQHFTSVSDLASKKIMSSILTLEHQQKKIS